MNKFYWEVRIGGEYGYVDENSVSFEGFLAKVKVFKNDDSVWEVIDVDVRYLDIQGALISNGYSIFG